MTILSADLPFLRVRKTFCPARVFESWRNAPTSTSIGADVVKASRKLDYRLVATARSIKPSDDPNILTVADDIGDPETAQRVISEGVAKFGRFYAGEQHRHLHWQCLSRKTPRKTTPL
jgi:hypothetical protein